MKNRDITESFAKGFAATQKGGVLAPDSLERGIKKFFLDPKSSSDGKPKSSSEEKPKTKTVTKTVTQTPAAEKPQAKVKVDLPVGYVNGKAYKLAKGDKVVDDKSDEFVVKGLTTDGNIKVLHSKNKVIRVISPNDIKTVNNDAWKLKESEDTQMKKTVKEGLADLADMAERDHEVQMARADLYKIAKYAIKLHDMLKSVSEAEGLEGWQQAKITKAADYIGSVYHNLEYDQKFNESKVEMCPEACCGKPVTECSCGPDCKHCDCHSKNAAMKESKHKSKSTKVVAEKAISTDPYKAKLAERLASKVSR